MLYKSYYYKAIHWKVGGGLKKERKVEVEVVPLLLVAVVAGSGIRAQSEVRAPEASVSCARASTSGGRRRRRAQASASVVVVGVESLERRRHHVAAATLTLLLRDGVTLELRATRLVARKRAARRSNPVGTRNASAEVPGLAWGITALSKANLC